MPVHHTPPLKSITASHDSRNQRGSVMVFVLILLVVVGAAVAASVYLFSARAQATAASVEESRGTYAAEGALEFAYATIWESYLAFNAGESGTLTLFRTYLENNFSTPLPDGATVDLTNLCPDFGIDVTSLTVRRADIGVGTQLLASATVVVDGTAVTYNRAFKTEPGEFKGLNFALLTNNVNCIFCHAQIDNVERFTSDTYPGVRVAALESLMLRVNSADSTIAGKLYIGGDLMDKKGDPIASLSGTELTSYLLDADDNIVTDANGDKLPTDFIEDDNYFLQGNADAFGAANVVESFPPAFPDENGNGVVDDAEYTNIAGQGGGTLSGGNIIEVPLGTTLTAVPTVATTTSIATESTGHLILEGTDANPIVIDGQVTIPGDVLIKGKIKGSGSLWARGNVYIVGDLEYADGTDEVGDRTFGVAADQTQNALGLTAGGNILIGDYLTPKGGDTTNISERTTGESDGEFNFTLSEITIFNRREYAKTQAMLPSDEQGTLVANPNYDPNYTPRYYVQSPGDDVPVMFGPDDKGKYKHYWDPAKGNWAGKEHVSKWKDGVLELSANSLPAGTVTLPLSPQNGWMSESLLKSIWAADELARQNGDKFNVDALLYTNNAIMLLTRKATASVGQIVMNGGLVARDMGILAAGPGNGSIGLELNYDKRVKAFLPITEGDGIEMGKSAIWTQRAPAH